MDSSFGTWIKRRRKALDLTQPELAERVGCSVSLIFKIESDERRPSRQIAELLAKHLEIPPDQRELFLKVARQERAVDGLESVSPRSAPAPFSQAAQPSLPVSLTPLIGREPELRIIIQQLQDPACRLLTLSGPGGVGKTRLALEVAHRLQTTFAEGAYFVSLAGTSASEFIVPAIANAIGLSLSGTAEPNAQLIHFLSDKEVLLVLDNLEHLLDGIELLDQLLQGVSGLKLLTTCREPLNLRTEWVFQVQGLPIPSGMDAENVASNSAAALFMERARQVRLNFLAGPEDLAAIAQICHLVEGLPLGLELAATWVNTLTCREIAVEIERNLNFLSTNRRDIPERHRSLQAVFEYSWNLLSAEEQAVMKTVSLFRSGFQREAAEQVAAATLPLLSSLIAKSFLRRSESGRYSQHELVRQYAAMRLHEDPHTESSARDRHARYYLALWASSENGLKSSKQRQVMQSLIVEIDNFRAAWDWAVTQRQFELLGSCLRALLLVYDLRGWYAEGIERLESMVQHLLLSAADLQYQYPEMLGLASALRGWFHFRRGQLQKARECFEQSLNIVRSVNLPVLLAEVLSLFGPVMTSMGETEKALQYVSEGLEAARASGDLWHIAHALMMQGGILAGSGSNEEAYASSKEALEYFRALGDNRLIIVTLNTLGFAAKQSSRLFEARTFLEESLTLVNPAEDAWSAGTAYGNLGIVELAQGNVSVAKTLLQKSISLFTDLDMKADVAVYQTYLGEAFAAQGAINDAEEYLRDAIRIAREAQALPTLLAALIRLAQLYADRGDVSRAYGWAVQVAKHPASWQESKRRAKELREELQVKLPPQQLDTIPLTAPEDFPDQLLKEMFGR